MGSVVSPSTLLPLSKRHRDAWDRWSPRRDGEGQGGDDTDKREDPPTPVSRCQTFGGLFAGSQGDCLEDVAVVSLRLSIPLALVLKDAPPVLYQDVGRVVHEAREPSVILEWLTRNQNVPLPSSRSSPMRTNTLRAATKTPPRLSPTPTTCPRHKVVLSLDKLPPH